MDECEIHRGGAYPKSTKSLRACRLEGFIITRMSDVAATREGSPQNPAGGHTA